MKKLSIKILMVLGIPAVLLAVGCSSEPLIEPIDDGSPEQVTGINLSGSIKEDRSLDASKTYLLSGVLSVQSGATLTIPAGTQIIAQDNSNATDLYIIVQQGAKIQINGTASNPVVMTSESGKSGSWGGLIIAGKAETTEGIGAIAEVGGIIYGGTETNDNSGNISYLVISDAGAQINSESQYNGLSLYAVGAGTNIQNLAIKNGADDGVEFFGGSVSVTNLYLENNEDDAVDWTEGWNGTVNNTYVLHSIANFSTAIEADGKDNNPTFNNFTAVSTSGGTGLQFKKQSGATINGLSLSGYDTSLDIVEEGRSNLSNIKINGEPADLSSSYSKSQTVEVSAFDWITNRGQVSVLPETINSDLSLSANTEYVINGVVSVENGASLHIPAGTRITARSDNNESGSNIYIVVQKGAKINVQGTATNPVIMSSTSGNAGSWGGLVIAGKAKTTEGINATAEVGGIIYGGTDSTDNSGSISYLVISDAGAQINSESQYNGLSLYAVGSGTSIKNLAIKNGADDGVEFFGGSVSITNLYLEDNEDDAVDWTEGWNGSINNTYVLHTIANFSTAIEADGKNNMPVINNFTAISETGGTALQFKKQSGAIINGLSLSGYDTALDIAETGRTDLSGIKIEGAAASLNSNYETESSVDISIFNWVN